MLGRRRLITGVAGMAGIAGLGGQTPPRPDQTYRPGSGGSVAPGSPQIFRGRLVVIYGTGPGTGIFVYSGTPGHNNLIASITAASGTDPYGNFYRGGIDTGENTFGTGTNIFGNTLEFWNASSTPIQLSMSPTGLFVYKPGGGAGNLLISIAPASGTDSYGNAYPAGSAFYGNNTQMAFPQTGSPNVFVTGTSIGSVSYITLGGVGIGNPGKSTWVDNNGILNAPNPAAAGPETWHNLTLANSWAMRTGLYARYRLMPDNSVKLNAKLTAGTLTGGTVIATLPTGYLPAFAQPVPVILENPTTVTAPALTPRADVQTNGQIQVFNLPAGLTQCSINDTFPLD